jgi:hypothetical protein
MAWSWRKRGKEAHDSRRESSGWVTTRLRLVFHAGRRDGGVPGQGIGRAEEGAEAELASCGTYGCEGKGYG